MNGAASARVGELSGTASIGTVLIRGIDLAPSAQGQHSAKLARSLHAGRIADGLREVIISGQLSPRTALTETRLSEQLGVSRGPVRSALTVLEGEGLVETKTNGRMVVVGFDRRDLEDLFDTRYLLEAEAIRLLLKRRSDLDPIARAFDAIKAEGNSTTRLPGVDLSFHRAIVESSGSRFLTRAWLTLAPVIQAAITIGNRHLAEQDPELNFARIVDSHKSLLDALRTGEAATGQGALERQFSFSKSMVQPGA